MFQTFFQLQYINHKEKQLKCDRFNIAVAEATLFQSNFGKKYWTSELGPNERIYFIFRGFSRTTSCVIYIDIPGIDEYKVVLYTDIISWDWTQLAFYINL